MENPVGVDWSRIPAPVDDGLAAHLPGMALPSVRLAGTDGNVVDLSKLPGRSVIYIYPMTGRPDMPAPDGWDAIPGARGCTLQSCAFRDHFATLRDLGVRHLFGLSVQGTAYQKEAADRLHLPFPLLSDEGFALARALELPTLLVHGQRLLKRMTIMAKGGRIEHVFYPVFPPDRNADRVIEWLQDNP
ncbi:peroxiredoxin [Pontibaca methylaminivorans]|uniref:peroxiredoxin n=1 Tax=Pontibaca methylaminivorans TaxID=515897 RepID=UPI002FDAAD79